MDGTDSAPGWICVGPTGWIRIDYGTDTDLPIVNQIRFRPDTATGRPVRAAVLEGSNDGTSYVTIHSISREYDEAEDIYDATFTGVEFRYFRLTITRSNSSGSPSGGSTGFGELELWGYF